MWRKQSQRNVPGGGLFWSQLLKLNTLLTFCSIGEPSGHRRSRFRSRSVQSGFRSRFRSVRALSVRRSPGS